MTTVKGLIYSWRCMAAKLKADTGPCRNEERAEALLDCADDLQEIFDELKSVSRARLNSSLEDRTVNYMTYVKAIERIVGLYSSEEN